MTARGLMGAAVQPVSAGVSASAHILISLDAVGGVWRYAMDLAASLAARGYRITFAGFGPAPSGVQRAEAERLGELVWLDAPLDWMIDDESELERIPALLRDLVRARAIDCVQLNAPSQAYDLKLDVPLVVVSHSCVVTWFAAVRQSAVPADWHWQWRRNRAGFDAADVVLAPSRAHADMLVASYGGIEGLGVVHNGTRRNPGPEAKQALVFSAGRWWDDGKNGAMLDAAAMHSVWPVVMAGPVDGPNGQHCAIKHASAIGARPHGETLGHMARAAIFASPSLYEPFGLAPLEAARAGAALVLSDIATYRELWDGAALFAPPDDPRAFAEAINALAGDEGLRAQFALEAWHRSQRYTLSAQAAAMHAVYDRLLRPAAANPA